MPYTYPDGPMTGAYPPPYAQDILATGNMVLTLYATNSFSLATNKCVLCSKMPFGTLLQTLYGHQGAATTIAISPDGKLIASGSEDSSIKLCDSLSGNVIRTLEGSGARVASLNFGSGGRLVSSAGEAVRVWDTKSGKNVAVLQGHEAEVTSVAWDPNGKRIISGSSDGTITFWDPDRLASPFMLRTSSAIEVVAFSPNGNEIVATTSVALTGRKSVSAGTESPSTTQPGRMLVWRASPPAP